MVRLISFKIPEGMLKEMDKLIKAGLYPNRSTLIRTAVRDLLKKELWNNDNCDGSWRLRTLTVKIPEWMLRELRELVTEKKRYQNIADVLRFAARDLLERERNLEPIDVTPVTFEPPKRINPEKYLREVEER